MVASLESELEAPPERFKDPVTLSLMNEPMVIETGHVFDKSTLYDENGNFLVDNFKRCPMTRQEIQPLAFKIVLLKEELIEYKLRRLDAVLAAAKGQPAGSHRSTLLRKGKELLDQLGSKTYIHRAEKYWTLQLNLEAGAELVDAVNAFKIEQSVGKLDASAQLRALFDAAKNRLLEADMDAGAATDRGHEAVVRAPGEADGATYLDHDWMRDLFLFYLGSVFLFSARSICLYKFNLMYPHLTAKMKDVSAFDTIFSN